MSTESPFWDHKYDRRGLAYGEEPNLFLTEYAPRVIARGGRVLSLGEGEGRNAIWLAKQGFSVTAVDFSKPAIQTLRELAAESATPVEALVSDVLDYDMGVDHWDAIVLLHMHLAPEPRHRLHRRIVDALRPRGALILEALHTDQLHSPSGGPDEPDLYYTADLLRRDFPDLETCALTEHERPIQAGEHRGITSVVGFVGQKR